MKKSYWGLLAICLFYGCSTKTSQPVVAPRVSKPPSPIHEPPMEVEKPASIPCASDDDNDGVKNCNDKCSGTSYGVKVDSRGCRIDPCTLDDDNDGVKNCNDKCSGTSYGVKVDSRGCRIDPCTLDDDNDGVKNCNDKCPSTPSGVKVNSKGCRVRKCDQLKEGGLQVTEVICRTSSDSSVIEECKAYCKEGCLSPEVCRELKR